MFISFSLSFDAIRQISAPLRFDLKSDHFKSTEVIYLKTINLRDYYLHYKEDEFYEVPDAIADLLREFERKEKNYIRKIKRYRAYFSLDVGDKIESETLLSQNDPADILELRMLFEIAYQSLDMLTRKQGLRVYKYLFLGMSIEEISEEEERSTTSVKNSGYSSLSKRFALSLICFSINLSRSFGRL